MKGLKNETGQVVAYWRQLVLGESGDVAPGKGDPAGRRQIEPRQQAEQGRLAAAAVACDDDELSFGDGERNILQNGNFLPAEKIIFCQPNGFEDGIGHGIPFKRIFQRAYTNCRSYVRQNK